MPLNNASQAAVLRDGRRRMPGVNPKNLQFLGDSLNSTFVETATGTLSSSKIGLSSVNVTS